MRAPVFRALDRTSVFFGIRGSYITYAAIIIGAAAIGGIFIGSLLSDQGIVSFVMGFGLAAAAYLFVLSFQAKHDERERDQMIASLKLPDFIRCKPIPIIEQLNKLPSKTEDLFESS